MGGVDLLGPATCFETNTCVCENFTSVIGIAQPVNIITALIIALVGLFIFSKLKKKYYKTALGYSLGLVAVGIAAMYMHYRMDYLGQVLDFTTVTLTIILLEVIAKFKKDSYLVILFMFIGVFLFNIYFPEYRVMFAGVSILYYLYMNVVVRKNWKKIRLLAFSFMFGVSLWYLDDMHWVCNPTSVIQLHAIWHIIVAILSYYNAKYYFKYVFPKAFN